MKMWLALAALASGLYAQSALLNSKDGLELAARLTQLTEATSLTAPGLARAAAPMLENLKQDVTAGRMVNRLSLSVSRNLLRDSRAYLALLDGVPKPYPYPEEARRQAAELRDLVDRLENHFTALIDSTELQLRGSDRDNLRRYAEANRVVPAPTAGKARVVFLGDSITDGWRLNEYFPEKDYINRGISGQITGEMLGRMEADVIAHKPQAMLFLGGTNDLARGVAIPTIESNLTAIADLAEFHKIKVIFSSILPVSDHHKDVNPRFEMTKGRPPASILELNRFLQNLCKQRGFTYLDYFPATADEGGFLKADLADDGLHPNPAGYRAMAPLAQAAIDRTLGASTNSQQKSGKRRQ